MKNFKRSFFYAFVCLFVIAGTNTVVWAQLNGSGSGEKLTAAQWHSDLQYFQQLIHSKYSNLFYNVTAKEFDNAVAIVDKKIGTLSDIEMNVEMSRLVAMFKVGHTNVSRRSGTPDKTVPWVHPIPVKFYLFDEGLFIRSIDDRYKEALGGQVMRIGKTDVKIALEKMRPVIAFENEQGFKNMLQYYLNLPEFLQATGIIDDPTQVSITYTKDGAEKSITLHAEEMNMMRHGDPAGIQLPANWSDAYENLGKPNAALWLKEPGHLRYFEYLKDSRTVYVRHAAVQDEPGETIAAFFAKVFRFVDSNEVDKFILDIRLNGGGNNYLNKPVITGIVQARKINRKGHFFIITGKATFSAAQNLTNELEKYTEAIFVGEPTSENVNFYGDTRLEILPNSKLNINLSWLWWQNLDPRDKRQWTAPQLAADLSFDNYKKGIDPAMEIIMNYKEEAPIDDLLRALVVAGKYDEAVGSARQYLENPLHRYYKADLETKVNSFGYNLINQNKFEQANKVLYMNVQLFPESANAYDSYAESWLKLGNKEEATKNYKIAISKDPHGVTGENSRNALKLMEAKDDKKGF